MRTLIVCLFAIGLTTSAWSDGVRNRDVKLRSHQVKRGTKENILHHINASMTVKVPLIYRRQIKGKLLVIYKMPVKGGVYTYTQTDMKIYFKDESLYKWDGSYDKPHRLPLKVKYDGETSATDTTAEFYDYMLLIYTTEAEPKVFCSKSSWKPLYKNLLKLGEKSYFDSRAEKVEKLEKSLAQSNLRRRR